MPDRLCIDGVWYVREDRLPAAPQAPDGDRWVPIKELCREFGVDPHRAYDARRDGRLDVRVPHGRKYGARCRRDEFRRWVDEDLMR